VLPPRLYVITDRHATGGRPLVQVLAAVLRGAAAHRRPDGRLPLAVQLREKDLPAAALLSLARELAALTKAAGAALFVNDRLDIALACGAEGIHLPVSGLSPTDVRAIAPQLLVAVSTHAADEVEAAALAGACFAVFGPVFATPSKRGVFEPRAEAGLRAACRAPLPVLALGGITPGRASLCRAAGASGLACIRAVLSAPDPAAATHTFLECFEAAAPRPF
jgi:thiamine-phosphate pyrophosphorylase